MGTKYNRLRELFNESLNNNELVCTKDQLKEFETYGFILKIDDVYKDFKNNSISVTTIKSKTFNLCFNEIISLGNKLAINNKFKRIYFMNQETYEKYRKSGNIINRNSKEYYRIFNNEEWLIHII